MKALSEITQLLESPKKITITAHQNPDADAFGSSLGLYFYLLKKGHQVSVISGTTYAPFLAWMPGCEKIVVYETNKEFAQQLLDESDILFCLDHNTPSRTGPFTQSVEEFKGIRVLIDHHMFPNEEIYHYGLSSTQKSSTCEMVYDFICYNNDQQLINKDIADNLYSGTMTDTGGFRYAGTSANTHKMVAFLLECGAIPNEIATNIFDNYEEKRLRLLGHIFSNNLTILPNYSAALMVVDAKDNEQFNIGQGDTEGIVNFPLSLKGINFSTFMHEKGNEVRISFRSKNTVDVNLFSRTYFNGGGHKNAAGGRSLKPLAETIQDYHTALAEFSKNTNH